MVDVKITDLPISQDVTGDDILVIVDNFGTPTTKQTTLAEAINVGLPEVINANVIIKNKTNSQHQDSILPLGEVAYATDVNIIKIGDGEHSGGIYPLPSCFSAFRSMLGATVLTRSDRSPQPDPVLKLEINNLNEGGIFKVTYSAFFSVSPPLVYLSTNGVAVCPTMQTISKVAVNQDGTYSSLNGFLKSIDEVKSMSAPNFWDTNFEVLTFYEQDPSVLGYFYQGEAILSSNGESNFTISINWTNAIELSNCSISYGYVIAQKVA
jgi:hypothetical protein